MGYRGPVTVALIVLLMQYSVIQSQTFEDETENVTTSAAKEGLTRRLAKQWKMGAPIKLSEERKQDLTIAEYNKLIRTIVEDSGGSHVIDIGDHKPIQKLSSDRHDYSGDDGETSDKPTIPVSDSMKLEMLDRNARLKQIPLHRRKRAAVKAKYQNYMQWPNGTIPYVTTTMQTGDDFLPWIDEGVDLFHNESCIKWIERNDEVEYVEFNGGDQGGICSAHAGRAHGKPTRIGLDQLTGNCGAKYVVYHEMLHVAGFEHAQSRPDRYYHLNINWECIEPSTVLNYIKQPLDIDVEYDGASIMQYDSYIFNTCENKGTMETWNPSYDFLLYTLVQTFSHYDSQSVNAAYGCDEGCTDNCENGGFIRKTVDNDQCHCRCPEYLTGDTCASRTTTCGEIIKLQEGEIRQFNTSGFPDPYPVGEACTYLIKAPANNRILITLKTLDVPCGQDLEFKVNLIGQPGILVCGSLSSEKVFVTAPNSECNIAMVILHADNTSITPGSGASLEVRAFATGCIDNPCRNGGRCDEDIDTPAFCICPPGYSGDTCNFVTATGTVGCSLTTDVEGICCFSDVSTGYAEFLQSRLLSDLRIPVIFPGQLGTANPTEEAVLESNVEFEEVVRCLSFYEVVVVSNTSNPKITTTYIEKDGTVKLVSETVDTQNAFILSNTTLSRHMAKIRFSAVNEGISLLTYIEIRPGPCSNDRCASLSFELCDNGGTCMDGNETLFCDCLDGFAGPYCEIPLNETIKCTFETGTTCPFVSPSSDPDPWIPHTGPTPQKSTGPSGAFAGDRYLRTDAKRNRLTTSTLQLETDLSERDRCLVLNYNMNGRDIKSLAVLQNNSTLFEENGNKKNKWLTKMIDVTTTPQSNLTIIGEATNKKGDIAIDDLELLPFPCRKILACTFEVGYRPCTNSRKGKWNRQKGKTIPNVTGPENAYQGDYYVYLQSKRQKRAFLDIPHAFRGAACLTFFYHMYGANTGTLTVTVYTSIKKDRQDIWTLSGDQGNQWNQTSINIPVIDDLKVRIAATRTDAVGLGDIAIDTVVLKNIACP